ncbi:MAG: hypothetical protein CFE26_12285 [Verrucomicrobiales bacterium VVV1]|nr:MAG: hypothetical protein CFE26_12285 [Verrucomicrobiales bacterium VVV1]
MKLFPFIPLFALCLPAMAADPAPLPVDPPLVQPQKKLDGPPWLGFRVTKPDDTTRAHLPELPAGIGFVILSVDAKGPAEISGLQAKDVVWKFGDQMLVNEAQLVTLLRLKKPGEIVPLAVFRSGRSLEIPLTLGTFPLNRPLGIGPELDAAVIPGEGPRWYSTNPENRTATLVTDSGKAVLKRNSDGSGYELEIRDSEDALVFNGNLPANGDTAAVPETWRKRVCVVRKGLDNVLDGKMENVRPPRPRVVPVPPADH